MSTTRLKLMTRAGSNNFLLGPPPVESLNKSNLNLLARSSAIRKSIVEVKQNAMMDEE